LLVDHVVRMAIVLRSTRQRSLGASREPEARS
jgi:hypothetical protein